MTSRAELPSGTVTFLFTDIESSTESAAVLGDERYAELLQTHRDLLRSAFARYDGVEVATEGDAFFVAFARAADAVSAAIEGQRAVEGFGWPVDARLRVRMGLHTGEALVREDDYVGHDVHKAKRVSDAGHGGQILLSPTTASLVAGHLPGSVALIDLGRHRLKDLGDAQSIHQVVGDGLQAAFPRLRTLESLEHNLPVQLTSFVGRERELDEIRGLLDTARLLTITGAGGAGKTRLALQLLAEVLPSTPGGAWLADLAPLTDASLVPAAVAEIVAPPVLHALDASSTQQTSVERLVGAFTGRRALLLLDNCEHLLGACAELAEALLQSCPDLKIVVTTREPLGIRAETSWRLPSLATPDEADFAPDDLVAWEATRLFCERAAQTDASFRPTDPDARAIAEICRQLDGIPLAIELAAARVRALDAVEIAKRLDDRFRLLTGGSRTALPRQQTLRATVDWSYELLTEPQQALLDRLSVFAGGWTLDAAESVGADASLPREDVIDLLAALVDRSLVMRYQRDGVARFRLLDTIRAYAREKLVNSGHGAAVRNRHMAYYADVVDAYDRDIRGPREGAANAAMEVELDNVRAAFEWAMGQDPTTALRIAGMWWFFGSRGFHTELDRWAEAALAATPDEPSVARAAALQSLAFAHIWRGDLGQWTEAAEQSKHMSLEIGDTAGAARVLTQQMVWSALSGRPDTALAHAREALDYARVWDDERLEADALQYIADTDPTLTPTESRAVLDKVITTYRRLGDAHTETAAHWAVGNLARRTQDWETARHECETALELARSAGCLGCTAITQLALAWLARGRGDIDTANELCRTQLRLAGRLRHPPTLALILEIVAMIAYDRGDHARAARILGTTDAHRAQMDFLISAAAQPGVERRVERVRAALGPAEFAEAFASGQTMTYDQALDYALATVDHD